MTKLDWTKARKRDATEAPRAGSSEIGSDEQQSLNEWVDKPMSAKARRKALQAAKAEWKKRFGRTPER